MVWRIRANATKLVCAVGSRNGTEETKLLDEGLLSGLSKAGFKTDFGRDNTGWQFKYFERGGGYYFNVGCSDLIVSGKIKVVTSHDDIESRVTTLS